MRKQVFAVIGLMLLPTVVEAAAMPQTRRAVGRLTMEQQLARFEGERNRRLYNPQVIDGEARFGEERMDLARRVVDLMDERKCDEARELASEAGELTMAQRVRRWCRSGIYRYHGRVATGQ